MYPIILYPVSNIYSFFYSGLTDTKSDKSDKSRVGGPLATSSPDTKEKRAKQSRNTDGAGDSKDIKERMDVSEEASKSENGRAGSSEKPTRGDSAQMDFNLDDFLKIDSLPLLMVGT